MCSPENLVKKFRQLVSPVSHDQVWILSIYIPIYIWPYLRQYPTNLNKQRWFGKLRSSSTTRKQKQIDSRYRRHRAAQSKYDIQNPFWNKSPPCWQAILPPREETSLYQPSLKKIVSKWPLRKAASMLRKWQKVSHVLRDQNNCV